DRYQGASIQVVAAPPSDSVGGRRIAGAENVELRFGIVRTGDPGHPTAMARRVQTCPRVKSRIAGIHRDRVERPLQFGRFGIEGLDVTWRIHVVAGSDNHMVAENHGSIRGEILRVEASDFLLPDFRAVLRVQADDPIVVKLEIYLVLPHAEPAGLEARAA